MTLPEAKSQHHPVFADFPPLPRQNRVHLKCDFIGSYLNPAYHGFSSGVDYEAMGPLLTIGFDEEYFEWVDVLEAVRDAGDSFTMLELGAGYGRWGVRAALAAQRRGLKTIRLGFVEAEPFHAKWIFEHLRANGFAPESEDIMIFEGVVTQKTGNAMFYVEAPSDLGLNDPGKWYGQCILGRSEVEAENVDVVRHYDGRKITEYKSGWRAIEVPAISSKDLLRKYDHIDLVDMDVQGEELKVVESAMNEFNARVARLHIGTHSERLEAELRRVLSENGWHTIHDFGCNGRRQTPYGEIDFQDGVQSWINPRVHRGSATYASQAS